MSRAPDGRLEVMLRRAGGFRREGSALLAACPRCGKEKLHFRTRIPDQVRQRLAGDASKLYPYHFACFGGGCTGWDGKPEFALAEMLGISVGAARRELHGEVGLTTYPRHESPFDESEPLRAQDSPEVPWPAQYVPIGERGADPGTAYLEGRGIPAEVAQEYGVRYSVVERSVAFPVVSRGRLLGWQSRLIVPHEWVDDQGVAHVSNKAKTSDGLIRAQWMFGDRALTSDHALILEGPIDAIKSHLCGGNIASMGKVITPALLGALAEYPWRTLYLGLDADARSESDRVLSEFDQAIRWPGRSCRWIEWPTKRCKGCAGSGRVELEKCPVCSGKGRVQMDSGALSFDEVHDLWRAARPVHAGLLFFF